MFERFTERAKRAVFFARYEASEFGSPYIEAEHLLLGLLREHRALISLFFSPHTSPASIRDRIEKNTTPREKISTSVDLPLSHECKRALASGAEEAERLNQKHIDTPHLLLGLLRSEKSFAAQLLVSEGLHLDSVREQVRQSETPPLPRGSVLDRWLDEREARGGIFVIQQEHVGNGSTYYSIYASDPQKESGKEVNPAKKLTRLQKRLDSILDNLKRAIDNHEFEKARLYSNDERKERENLRTLREEFNLDEVPPLIPFLCVEIVRDDRFSDVQKRCNDHIAEGVPEVWILAPDLKRAYTVTKSEGIREFKSEILRIVSPPLELELKTIF